MTGVAVLDATAELTPPALTNVSNSAASIRPKKRVRNTKARFCISLGPLQLCKYAGVLAATVQLEK